jgi:hypothetical protein
MMKDLFRWTEDIGMFATDRPINDTENHAGTCDHRTPYCDDTCYNVKLYKMYPNMSKRDDRCETEWQSITPSNVSLVPKHFAKKRKQTKRIRFNTRGEAIKDITDIYRVKAIVQSMPDTTWWLPTRAWSNTLLKELIQIELFPLDNIAINASLDPSNTTDEWRMLEQDGWNIMFFGDDDLTHSPATGERLFACPKTHKKMKGHCEVCKAGCFSQATINKQKLIHLSEH